MPGDTAVETYDGVRCCEATRSSRFPPPTGATPSRPTSPRTAGWSASTPAGNAILVAATDDGRTWDSGLATHTGRAVSGAVVAGNGDHVAVVLLGDDPDGSIPVLEVQVSHDAGRTWTWARDLDTDGGDKVRDLSSLAVTPTGTTYLATGSHHLVRIDAEGDVLPIQLSSFDSTVFEHAGEPSAWSASGDTGTSCRARPTAAPTGPRSPSRVSW